MVCVQCGKCASVCEAGAITKNAKGVYMINKKLCTGCGKCVEVCPFGVMVKAPEAPTTVQVHCLRNLCKGMSYGNSGSSRKINNQ